jgi:ligand-binding SRPBCC domain-containing protein
LPLHWQTVITEYEPPFFFVDEQAAGPYTHWHHRHGFKPTEYGALVSDCLDYALPFGALGRLAHRLAVRKQPQPILDYRQNALAGILTGAIAAK